MKKKFKIHKKLALFDSYHFWIQKQRKFIGFYINRNLMDSFKDDG